MGCSGLLGGVVWWEYHRKNSVGGIGMGKNATAVIMLGLCAIGVIVFFLADTHVSLSFALSLGVAGLIIYLT